MKTFHFLLSIILSLCFSLAVLFAVQQPVPARPGGGSSFKSSRSSSSQKSDSSQKSGSSKKSSSSSGSSSSSSSSPSRSSSSSSSSPSRSSSSSSSSYTASGSSGGGGIAFGPSGFFLILDAMISITAVFAGYHGILGRGVPKRHSKLRILLYSVLVLLGLLFAISIFPILNDILYIFGVELMVIEDGDSFMLVFSMFHSIVVGIYWAIISQRISLQGKRVVTSSPTVQNIIATGQKTESSLQAFKQKDPNFSEVLFLDFVSLLYHKYYSYLGTSQSKELRPFFDEMILEQAKHNQRDEIRVSEIVIGNMKIELFKESETDDLIYVELDANYTITRGENSERRVVLERWLLARHKGLVSLEPEKMRILACPSCGAPAKLTDSGTCEYCGNVLRAGLMQWYVRRRIVVKSESFSTGELGTYAEEQGTQLATRFQHNLAKISEQFAHTHKVNWPAFRDNFIAHIVTPCFLKIYSAWSRQQWQEIRHLVSDRLYASNQFWIDAYKSRGFVNRLEKIEIAKTEVVRIELDTFYESITARIFASCLDYVEDEQGQLIGGSKRKPRKYSEYWTFIRRNGVETDASSVDLQHCPNCGAPADKMGQSAECGYCDSKISYGDYSWVLAVIEQDDSYGS